MFALLLKKLLKGFSIESIFFYQVLGQRVCRMVCDLIVAILPALRRVDGDGHVRVGEQGFFGGFKGFGESIKFVHAEVAQIGLNFTDVRLCFTG